MATVAPIDTALVADGVALGVFGITTLKTALDALFGKAEVEVPKVEGDGATALISAIEQHVPAAAQPYLATILGVADAFGGSITEPLTATVVAALKQASLTVDAALSHEATVL
jgi:hypothetical protein